MACRRVHFITRALRNRRRCLCHDGGVGRLLGSESRSRASRLDPRTRGYAYYYGSPRRRRLSTVDDEATTPNELPRPRSDDSGDGDGSCPGRSAPRQRRSSATYSSLRRCALQLGDHNPLHVHCYRHRESCAVRSGQRAVMRTASPAADVRRLPFGADPSRLRVGGAEPADALRHAARQRPGSNQAGRGPGGVVTRSAARGSDAVQTRWVMRGRRSYMPPVGGQPIPATAWSLRGRRSSPFNFDPDVGDLRV